MATTNHVSTEESDDGFENNREIQQLRAEIKAQEELIAKSLRHVQLELRLEENPDFKAEKLAMNDFIDVQVESAYRTTRKTNVLNVLCVSYYTEYKNAKGGSGGDDYYLIGQIETSKSYPNTYIHKETLKDKILDLFLKCDLDFEQSKIFSKKFQVFTDDKVVFYNLMKNKNLDILAEFPDMELHFYNQILTFRTSRKPIALSEASAFCALSNRLLNLID